VNAATRVDVEVDQETDFSRTILLESCNNVIEIYPRFIRCPTDRVNLMNRMSMSSSKSGRRDMSFVAYRYLQFHTRSCF